MTMYNDAGLRQRIPSLEHSMSFQIGKHQAETFVIASHLLVIFGTFQVADTCLMAVSTGLYLS